MRLRFFALFLDLALSLFSTAAYALEPNDKAPPLQVARWLRGGPFEAYAEDRTYLLTFWATWAADPSEAFASLGRWAKRFEAKNVTFLCVSIDGEETADRVERYQESFRGKKKE